jgi:hypothetical protein
VLKIHAHARSEAGTSGKVTPIADGRSEAGSQRSSLDAEEDVKMKSGESLNIKLDVSQDGTASGDRTPISPVDSFHDARSTFDLDVVEERVVWHFLYKKWPDFGVPSLEDLESFFTLMRLSREKNVGPHNPRIVHCSAGVGRSGTFMALEHLLAELDAGLLEQYDEQAMGQSRDEETSNNAATSGSKSPQMNDLIYETVSRLREQRRTMVQAEAQYLFIYQVLRNLWIEKYGTDDEVGEPAAKRLEIDPSVDGTGLIDRDA